MSSNFLNHFEQLTPTGIVLFLVWLTAVGGCVGSFLNVVVYRLPLGKSVVRPGSFCPKCKTPIRWYDNIPVISWFILRGRCRFCHEPFSFRYPAIEAIVAALFFLFTYVELLSDGANLPGRLLPVVDGFIIQSLSVGQLSTVFAFHLTLLVTLLASGLIELDRNSVPVRLFVPAWIFGIVGPFFLPALHPVATTLLWLDGPIAGLVDSSVGAICGAAAGIVAFWIFSIGRKRSHDSALVWSFLTLGLFLGLSGLLVIWPITIVIGLVGRIVRRDWPDSLVLFALALIFILFWAKIV